jgi:DNA-binding transcriptional ArsR family regulator
MITTFQPMTRTAYDHPDFKLNEQQEAVIDYMLNSFESDTKAWFIAYELHGAQGYSGMKLVTIGDAGRRMRELREAGILESRKRGRYEEYRVKPPTGRLF